MAILDNFEMKELQFDFDELARSTALTRNQSMTDSVINMLGFNNVDVEDEKNEMVGQDKK